MIGGEEHGQAEAAAPPRPKRGWRRIGQRGGTPPTCAAASLGKKETQTSPRRQGLSGAPRSAAGRAGVTSLPGNRARGAAHAHASPSPFRL